LRPNAATTYASLTVTSAFTVNGVANVSQTGDSYARLGAPVGASHSADVAAVKGDTAAVKLQTDKMVFTVAGYLDVNAYKWVGGTIPAVNVAGVPLVDMKYVLGTISPAAAGSVRADAVTGAVGSVTGAVGSVTGAVGSVTGAVGSVTGNVGGNVAGSVASVTAAITLPAIPASWITAAGITAGALNGKGDWLLASSYAAAPSAAAVRAEMDSNSTKLANLDATVSSRLAAASYTAPNNAGITAIQAKTDNLPVDPADESLIIAATDAVMTRIGVNGAGLTALGDARLAHLDANVSSVSGGGGTCQAGLNGVNLTAIPNLDVPVSSRSSFGKKK
jgi:hypothetical protein